MEGITEVGDRTYRLEVPSAGAFVPTVSYFITDGDGALIEPGPGSAIPTVTRAMEHLGLSRLAYIIPTHIHVDHAGGAGALAALCPEATVLVHPIGARHLVHPARLIEITQQLYGSDFETRSGTVLPVPPSRLRAVRDGEIIALAGRELQLIHAPGHAPHHLAILDRSRRGLFCGEALGVPPHLLPSVAPFSFDEEDYLSTIERLRQLEPRVLFYSHGGADAEPAAAFSRAEENTRIYSRLALDGLSSSDSRAEIALRFAADVKRRFGLVLDPVGAEMFVIGYAQYYEKKGLA
jgi:glyoxylase-like metal-dependent hydrolase (beta-lactamase superfamily II)